jgi:hypothetical protein
LYFFHAFSLDTLCSFPTPIPLPHLATFI